MKTLARKMSQIRKSGLVRIGLALSLALMVTVFSSSTFATNTFSANLMAPLHVEDWSAFEYELKMAKDMGADGISVDVWWGDVEKNGDNVFDWSYYDTIFQKIQNAGLKVVPIMSFHQCGGNVGDDYTAYLPSWVWSKYEATSYKGLTLSTNDLKYVSELGNVSNEYLSLWVDDLVSNEYSDFMNAFETQYGSQANLFMELNVSCGPAGELRYPSYNSHDAGNTYSGYPNKGYLQAYSNVAQNDFRTDMLAKYGSLNGVNQAWSTQLSSAEAIKPPADGASFFYDSSKPYLNTQYGQDFIAWYNLELADHGGRMLDYADAAFDGALDNIPLGIKIPGVHWQIENSAYPRTAEINAGLISTDFSTSNDHGYGAILSMIESFTSPVTLHFTCLEMDDNNSEPTSKPKTLVGWIGDAAYARGLDLKGENALNGGNDSPAFWDNIMSAISNHHYNGLTMLRLNDGVYGTSNVDFRIMANTYDHHNHPVITFKVHNAITSMGENLYVVGNHPALGDWDPEKALPMYTYDYPSWTGSSEDIPVGTSLAFKFIKKDGNKIVWESNIQNRTLTLEDNMFYEGQWNE